MTTNPQQQPIAARAPSPDAGLLFESSPVQVDVSGLSHTGKVRPRNEDHFLIARTGCYLETVLTSLPPGEVPQRRDDAGYTLIVADGMGGHAAGELASRMAIRELVKIGLSLPEWIVRIEESTSAKAVQRSRRRVKDVNKLLIEHGRQDPKLRGMGSTLTAVRNLERILQIVHVGDSRAYVLREGTLHRLTRDHTYVQMLVDSGQLSKADAAKSTARHVLTNAVGGFNEDIEVDVDRLALVNGDRVLLCSDGLTDLVDDETIRGALVERTSSKDACQALIDLALEGGGKDNITAVVAKYSWAEGT